MNFFYVCIEELSDYVSETIRYNALSHRLSKLEPQEFDKMMAEPTSQSGDAPKVVVDHEAQMKKAQGLKNG